MKDEALAGVANSLEQVFVLVTKILVCLVAAASQSYTETDQRFPVHDYSRLVLALASSQTSTSQAYRIIPARIMEGQ